MKMLKLLRDRDGSFSLSLTQRCAAIMLPDYGVALLFYRPERRLSISVWTRTWSRNIRLWGPLKLSWER
jgi:hypothetical protein